MFRPITGHHQVSS